MKPGAKAGTRQRMAAKNNNNKGTNEEMQKMKNVKHEKCKNARMGNNTKRVQVRCAQRMMRAIFS